LFQNNYIECKKKDPSIGMSLCLLKDEIIKETTIQDRRILRVGVGQVVFALEVDLAEFLIIYHLNRLILDLICHKDKYLVERGLEANR